MQLYSNNVTSIGDVVKHKFKVEAATTELLSSEAFKLPGHWDKIAKAQDKSGIQ